MLLVRRDVGNGVELERLPSLFLRRATLRVKCASESRFYFTGRTRVSAVTKRTWPPTIECTRIDCVL